MAADRLELLECPQLAHGRLVLGFSGWMDGGGVSTGTVEWLQKSLDVRKIAAIDPEGFYITSFPGSMEVSALFRPHTKIEDGLVTALEPPESTFHCDAQRELVLFSGKEPNLHWADFADCIFRLAAAVGVRELYFVGSFGGAVPHTREPRLLATVSEPESKRDLRPFGVGFTSYEGPASFTTYLLSRARAESVRMASLVAEIPAYIQGPNPKCLEAVLRKLAGILALHLNLAPLRELAAAWEERLNAVLEGKPELAQHIRKLEEDYDNEVFDTQMGDLKEWLQQQGIRVD